jgi:SPP1 family predicted phage head-tail adaptor
MAEVNIEISELRTRITFQQPTLVEDAGKAQSQTYANISTNPTVWARRINAHGAEVVKSDALRSAQRATLTFRYRSDVLATWLVLMDNEPWKIIAPPDHIQDRNRWTEIVVERVKGTV